jgi:glycosyltransferase involved in cell wall biosynthesis
MDMSKEKITVVIPAFIEQATIGNVISRCRPFCDEVIVVNALHSKDDTRTIAREMGATVLVDGGRGKGDGIRKAIAAISEGIVVFIDADGSHIPEDIPLLLEPLRERSADLVIASRVTGGTYDIIDNSFIENFVREYGSKLIAFILNLRFRSGIKETQNGFRAMRIQTLKELNLTSDHTEIETEMCLKCLKKGLTIKEVPSTELKREHGISNIVLWRDAFKYFKVIICNLF